MARYASAVWMGSPNDNPGGMVAYDNLILHRAQGSFAGTESWLQNPAAQVSAHFVIDAGTGQLVQLVDTSDKAWAEASGNPRNISLEISGFVADPVSPAAVVAIGKLLAWCHVTHGVQLRINDDPTPGVGGLGWHGMGGIAWGNHPDCPGDIVKNLRDAIVGEAVKDLVVWPVKPDSCIAVVQTPTRAGYWQVGSDGSVFHYGDAGFHGSLAGKALNQPVVGLIPGPGGYWLVAADGGVFCFGVPFYGSLGGKTLNAPIIGGGAAADGKGYELYARDFGVFAFGDAPYFGNAIAAPTPQT